MGAIPYVSDKIPGPSDHRDPQCRVSATRVSGKNLLTAVAANHRSEKRGVPRDPTDESTGTGAWTS
jgi:hypothetical protein